MGPSGLVANPPPELARATTRFCELSDLPLVGLEFSTRRGRLVVSDLHLFPDLDWWSLSEAAFSRVVGSFTDYLLEIAARPHAPRYPGIKRIGQKKLAKSGR